MSDGNDMHNRESASAQFAECMVASTRCPVSAAFRVRRITSGVRISLMTSTSGFSRNASMMPCSKLGECVGISRCRMNDCRLANRYSIGLSSVMMLRARVALISSSSAASVVDFPEPVGPEMMIRPLAGSMSLRKSLCKLQLRRSLMLGASSRMASPQPADGLEEIRAQPDAAHRFREIGGAALDEIRPALGAQKLARHLHERGAGNDAAHRLQIAADPRDDRGIRLEVQIAGAQRIGLFDPLFELHNVPRGADVPRRGCRFL